MIGFSSDDEGYYMKCRLCLAVMVWLVFSLGNLVSAGDLKERLPSAGELADFKIMDKPATYHPANLWNYINGGASIYLAYDFEELVTFTTIHRTSELEIVVDIYDMGKPINAYGIYSVERCPDGKPIKWGCDGSLCGGALYFWQDRYYVKLMPYYITPRADELLPKLAGIISRKLPDVQVLPRQLAVFPQDGRIKNSDRYIKKDILGQDYFQNGFRMEYDLKGHQYTILLIEGATPQETDLNLKRYRAYLDESGKVSEKISGLGEQAFLGKDRFYGTVIFARKKRFIIGVLGLKDVQGARNIIKTMFGKLYGW